MSGNKILFCLNHYEARLYSIDNDEKPLKLIQLIEIKPRAFSDRQMYFDSKGKGFVVCIASSHVPRQIHWSINSQKAQIIRQRLTRNIQSLIFSETWDSLYYSVSLGQEQDIIEVCFRSGKQKLAIKTQFTNYINCLLLVKKNQFLIAGSADTHVGIFKVSTREWISRVISFPTHIYVMISTKSNFELILGGYNSQCIKYYDLNSQLLY